MPKLPLRRLGKSLMRFLETESKPVAEQAIKEKTRGELRREILDQVFDQGVESVPAYKLHWLFDTTPNKLIRLDANPERLMKEGWKPRGRAFASEPLEDDLLKKLTPAQVIKLSEMGPAPGYDHTILNLAGWRLGQNENMIWDFPGLYWGREAPYRKQALYGDTPGVLKSYLPPFRRGQIQVPKDYWVEGIPRPGSSIKHTALQDASRPESDFAYRGGQAPEVIQTKGNKTLARWKDVFKIIGLAALMNEAIDDAPVP